MVVGKHSPGAHIRQNIAWLVDSGAPSHMTSWEELMTDYVKLEPPEKVALRDGRTVNVTGKGKVCVNILLEDNARYSVICDVFHVPDLACYLCSVRTAVKKGNKITFPDAWCHILNQDGQLCGIGSLVNRMYLLHLQTEAASMCEQNSGIDLWHPLLGHMNTQQIKEVVSKELVTGMKLSTTEKSSFCEDCVEGKLQRKTFKSEGEIRSKRTLQCAHRSMWSYAYRVVW